MINISEVDSRITEQLDAARKVFMTLESFCENMCMCAMMKLIKDGLKRPGTEGQARAWTIANNLLVATENQNISTGTPMSINMVLKAIELAQCHLEQSPMADEGDIEEISSVAVLATAKKPKVKRACIEDVDEGELSAAQIKELQNKISE
eukprot:1414732-Rhodomonas_salina.1